MLPLVLLCLFVSVVRPSSQLRSSHSSGLRTNAQAFGSTAGGAPGVPPTLVIPVAGPSVEAPPCPKGSTCLFKNYWAGIANQFCKGSSIRPTAINVCEWIDAHCAPAAGSDNVLVVDEPEEIIDEDTGENVNDPENVCRARETCPEGASKECFNDVWCQCNSVGTGTSKSYKFTSETGCIGLEKRPHCKHSNGKCHFYDGPPDTLSECDTSICPTASANCTAGKKYSQIVPPGSDTTLIGFCCGKFECVDDAEYCAPDLCVTTCEDGKIYTEVSPPTYSLDDTDALRCCGKHECKAMPQEPQEDCEECTEDCIQSLFETSAVAFQTEQSAYCAVEENKEDKKCLVFAKCDYEPVAPPVEPLVCADDQEKLCDDALPAAATPPPQPAPPAPVNPSFAPNVFKTNAGAGGWGGACTCPDGTTYQVGDKGDYCTALNCAGGVSGTCNRYNGDWSGNTVECGAETTSSFLQTMEATADANPDATCRCVDKCESTEIRNDQGNCVCKEGDEKINNECVVKCLATENRDDAGACQPTEVPCAADEEKISGFCMKKCLADENRVDGECVNPDCVSTSRQSWRRRICAYIRWGWLRNSRYCVLYRKCVEIANRPRIQCYTNPVCTELGRSTIMTAPCTRCGGCKTSPNGVCPQDSRNNNLLAIMGATSVTSADQQAKCSCECKKQKCLGEVTLYKHGWFNGHSVGFAKGDYDHGAMTGKGVRNDDVSSLKVPEGCKATLYQHGWFTGWHATFSAGEYNHAAMIGKGAKNDDMSSIKVIEELDPAHDPSTCQAPHIFLESTCGCGCENAAEKQQTCEEGAPSDVTPFKRWDAATCACVCDASSLSAEFQIQSAAPDCVISVKPEIITKCAGENKLPSADGSACECATDSPVCEAPMVRGDKCDCICPADAVSGESAAAQCEARHATLNPATCGCECPNECPSPQVHPSSGDCDVCSCPVANQCVDTPPIKAILSSTTCLFECDQAVNCPGNQMNKPLVASAAAAPAAAAPPAAAATGQPVCTTEQNQACGGQEVKDEAACTAKGGACQFLMTINNQKRCKPTECGDWVAKAAAATSTSTEFLQLMGEPTAVATADVCQCGCQCEAGAKEKCDAENKHFDALTCSCECHECGHGMKVDPATCACSCDVVNHPCANDAQALIETAEKDSCACSCPVVLIEEVKANPDFMLVERSCTKSCNSEVKCENELMGRAFEKECKCQCLPDVAADCENNGGSLDPATCVCSCVAPTNPIFKLIATAKYPDCSLACVPKPACVEPLCTLNVNEECASECTTEAEDKCHAAGKGEPKAPTCGECGECKNKDTANCGPRQIFDSETCQCKCRSVEALMCPTGNTGVDETSAECACKCAPPADDFMQIFDPQDSCEETCAPHDTCFASDGGSVTLPTKDSKCECECHPDTCTGAKTKHVWVSDTNKKLGCHCTCPTEPETCEEGYEWDKDECMCVCSPDSCNCGTKLDMWKQTCDDAGMIATDKCACACSDDSKSTCTGLGDGVIAAVTIASNGIYSCGCKCKLWETACPPSQTRTDHNGHLPQDFGGSIVATKKFVDHIVAPPAACTCACPSSAVQALVDAGTASSRALMVADDSTCTEITCPAALIADAAAHPPTNPLHMFNSDVKFCKNTCVATACEAGLVRKAFPNCDCACPTTAPVCTAGKSLNADCSSCVCTDRAAPYHGMVQDETTCEFTCAAKECNAGQSVQMTDEGCKCVCDRDATVCAALANMVMDPNTCQCDCDRGLPVTTAGGKRMYRLGEPGTDQGCGYKCDKQSDAATTCSAKDQDYSDVNADGTCDCSCDQHAQCPVVVKGMQHIQLVNRIRKSGLCGCACPLDVLEHLTGTCPGAHKINRNNCKCQCPGLQEGITECSTQGLAYDFDLCKCKPLPCSGRMTRSPGQDECSCPSSTLNRAAYGWWVRIMMSNRMNQGSYKAINGAQCNWDCADHKKQACISQGKQPQAFPYCGCINLPNPPPPPGPCKFLGSHWGWICRHRIGCNSWLCKTQNTKARCEWNSGSCSARD